MVMETSGIENVLNPKGVQTPQSANSISEKPQSIQAVKQQMQMDPTYQPTFQEKTVMNAIEKANKKLEGADKEFEFAIHEKTKQIMIKVLDVNTKEVIKELPPEKILDMVAAMCENAGLFVDEKL